MKMWLRHLLLGLALGWLPASAVQAVSVLVVSSESGAVYTQAAQALIGELEKRGLPRHEVLTISADEWTDATPSGTRLIVSLGARACSVVAQPKLQIPVLCTLLPLSSFQRLLRENGRRSSPRFTALYLDQPFSRQLNLIRRALPDARQVGVLWGPESGEYAPALTAQASNRGLSLVTASVGPSSTLFPALKWVLQDVDLLLAVPDPQVYNSSTVQNILLASFRAKTSVVAFSPAYVKAGALLAVYVTPTQIGAQAGALASAALLGKDLPATPVHSLDFELAVNEPLAHSLGLSLSARELREKLRQDEGLP